MSSLRNNYHRLVSTENSIFIIPLTDDGDSRGNNLANVNGSVTPVDFWVQPDPDERFEVVSITIELTDAGNPGQDDYGNIAGPLLNGIQFFLEFNGNRVLFGRAIASNLEFQTLAPFNQIISYAGNVSLNTFTINVWSHAKSGIFLNGDTNDKFGIIIQDDLSTLVNHTFTTKGNVLIKVAS